MKTSHSYLHAAVPFAATAALLCTSGWLSAGQPAASLAPDGTVPPAANLYQTEQGRNVEGGVTANVSYNKLSDIVICETITDLGGGQWHYDYEIIANSETTGIWFIFLYTSFPNTSATPFNKTDWNAADATHLDFVFPCYDARNIEPGVTHMTQTWGPPPFGNSPNPIAPGELVGGFSFVASVFDPNPKLYGYEVNGNYCGGGSPSITAIGYTDCSAENLCPWDHNGDGKVDGADLGQLLANWGNCKDCNNCPWDYNGDCKVDGADLGQLLANWGDCPKEQVCDEPFVCGQHAPLCNEAEQCYCFGDYDGDTYCIRGSTPCSGIECPDGTCPPDHICIVDSCCGPTVCIPNNPDNLCEPDKDPEPLCEVGFVCGGPIFNCPGFEGTNCYCWNGYGGGYVCGEDGSCAAAPKCPTGSCPAGYVCAVDTCCGEPVCLLACDEPEPLCSDPFSCGGAIQWCNDAQTCACIETYDGKLICVENWTCTGIECANGSCPPDHICIVNSCCGATTCMPVSAVCQQALSGGGDRTAASEALRSHRGSRAGPVSGTGATGLHTDPDKPRPTPPAPRTSLDPAQRSESQPTLGSRGAVRQ